MGNSSLTSLCSKSEGDEECEEDDMEVTSQRPFGAILHRLRKLVLAANSRPQEFISTKNYARGIKC